MIGTYASVSNYAGFGGVNQFQGAVEGELYVNHFKLRGITVIENVSAGTFVDSGGAIYDFGNSTRFFDKLDLSYYATDNLRLSIGHRYSGSIHAAAVGVEYMWYLGSARAASLFAEGRLGEEGYRALWVGLHVYFGQNDKSLIRRNREDDPNIWEPDTILSVSERLGDVAGLTPSVPWQPPPPPPPPPPAPPSPPG